MKKYIFDKVELPVSEDPIFYAYHSEAAGASILTKNPSIRNWYLNNVVQLCCDRKFIGSFTTPSVYMKNSSYWYNPHFERIRIPMRFLGSGIHETIHRFLIDGFYVTFEGVDDYYIDGKSWYKERHFIHDGLICGYDDIEKTYSIRAYDKSWIYRTFKTPQRSFDKACKAGLKSGYYSIICGVQVLPHVVEIDENLILHELIEYLDSDFEKYPPYVPEVAFGIVVHDYVAIYLYKQLSGAFPYEKLDKRIFCAIWEHKRAMLERIVAVENKLCLGDAVSTQYAKLVKDAETMRMLYASHALKRRDNILIKLQEGVLSLKEKERDLLEMLIKDMKGKISYETVD